MSRSFKPKSLDLSNPENKLEIMGIFSDAEDRSRILNELRRLRQVGEDGSRILEKYAGEVRSTYAEPGPREMNVVVPDNLQKLLETSTDASLELQFRQHEMSVGLAGSLDSIEDSLTAIAVSAEELPRIREDTKKIASSVTTLRVQSLLQLAATAYSANELRELRCAFDDFANDAIFEMSQTRGAIGELQTELEKGFATTQQLLVKLAVHHENRAMERTRTVIEQMRQTGVSIVRELNESGRRVETRLSALLDVARNPARTTADELVNFARIEISIGNSTRALTQLEHAIEKCSIHPEAWLMTGSILWDSHYQTKAGDCFDRAYKCTLRLRDEEAFESAVIALAAWHRAVGLDDVAILDKAVRAWEAECPTTATKEQKESTLARIFIERSAISLRQWLETGGAPYKWPECSEFIRVLKTRAMHTPWIWKNAIENNWLNHLFDGQPVVEKDKKGNVVTCRLDDEVPYLWAGIFMEDLKTVDFLLGVLEKLGGLKGGPENVATAWLELQNIKGVANVLSFKYGKTWFIDAANTPAVRRLRRALVAVRGEYYYKCQNKPWIDSLVCFLQKIRKEIPLPKEDYPEIPVAKT